MIVTVYPCVAILTYLIYAILKCEINVKLFIKYILFDSLECISYFKYVIISISVRSVWRLRFINYETML